MPTPAPDAADPFDALYVEHDTIQPVLFWLETATHRLEQGQQVPPGFQAWAVDFFREFADRLHHAKEERVLIPAVARKWPGEYDEVLRALMEDHVTFRGHAAALAGCDLAQPEGRARYVQVGREYVAALRQHINDEHHRLFLKVQPRFSAEERAELARASAQAELEAGAAEVSARFVPRVHAWSGEFQAPGAGGPGAPSNT